MKKYSILLFVFLISTASIKAESSGYESSDRMDNYLESISNNRHKLYLFFQKMPKGGDLHNHLAGDSCAENLLKYAINDPVCIDNNYNIIKKSSNCKMLSDIKKNKNQYEKLITAWSMKNFSLHSKGAEHFFSTFDKFFPILVLHTDLILAEAVNNASIQHEKYLELMITPDHGTVGRWGKQIGWENNLEKMRKNLLKTGLYKDILLDSQTITADEGRMKKILECEKFPSKAVCKIQITYLYQVFREQSPQELFAQLITGFELSLKNPKVIGINLVQPENGKITLRDYDIQMKMIAFLHSHYPTVKITLHAGELPLKFIIKNKINNHIRNAIEIAHADRIGHGSDIYYENNHKQLLNEMRNKNIPVEISLTSNEDILGLTAKDSPLPLYLKSHVPVIISTDDEGVLRTNLSKEYLKAYIDFKLNYETLKKIDRNSLTYSFLPGKSLWDKNYKHVAKPCRSQNFKSDEVSVSCRKFLNENQKAFLQWRLERDFHEFEKAF